MPFNEQTPLLQTVIIASPRQRYSHNVFRRFCTIALSITLTAIVILFLLPVQWFPENSQLGGEFFGYFPWSSPLPHKAWPLSQGIPYEELQQLILNTPKEEKAREWSQYYTSGPHLAGKNLSQAVWTRKLWQEFGISDSSIVSYDVYLDYPVGHRLALLKKTRTRAEPDAGGKIETIANSTYEVKFECSLEEDILDEDPTSGLESRIPTFNGYSASGNVTAQYVYINYGTLWDFDDLIKANISLEGKIALVKYGRNFRGLKVKRAQELGMAGVIIYSDPQDDGNITEANGFKAYPDGPARNPSSVQRGSVEFLSTLPGDPTTPGYPSKPGVPRGDPRAYIPSIPSIPISYRDALPLLKALNGHGPNSSDFNEYWQGGGLGYKGVKYNIGPSPASLLINLVNEQQYQTTPIWNVIGIINGTLPDEVIILGNHRDAWIAGGAGDPNSGSAALNEVVRSFGVAVKKGWKPLRTIVFASWDGEEYGLLGSTEWVEEYVPWLSNAAIAYLNVDTAARGPKFHVLAAPLLNKSLQSATTLVQSPNQTIAGQTVSDVWDKHIGILGSGTDYTAFQYFAGVPSVDLGFTGTLNDPVYHYHSNYDSFAWMEAYGDPHWRYHITISKIWALLAVHLIESPVIPLNTTDYALSLSTYLISLNQTALASPNPAIRALAPFPLLAESISSLLNATTEFEAHAAALAAAVDSNIPWWKWWRKVRLYYEILHVNARYKLFERNFMYEEGLDGRNWFKHSVFAPGVWTGYGGVTFPGLRESIERGDLEGVQKWSGIIKKRVNEARDSLR